MPYVDYDRVATTYAEGRGPVAQAEAWRALVAPHLPRTGRCRVLDLGAGTGIFARNWPRWGATDVLAVEPSLSMLGEAGKDRPGSVRLTNGRAESLPLRSASVDVAWLSAVFHHFADRRAAVRELGRVLVETGVVLVRSYFPELGPGSWHDVFPGAAQAQARFPTLAAVEAAFATAGFGLRDVPTVDGGQAPASECAAWARRMRDADTFLSAVGEDEFAQGLERLDAADDEPLDLPALHLAVLART